MLRTLGKTIALACAGLVLDTILATAAVAEVYYVGPTGSDNYSCEQAMNHGTPKSTINEGATCLSAGAGDTLIVKAGIYDEILPDIIPSGAPGNPTTLRSETQYGAVIQPSAVQSGQLFDGVGVVAFASKQYIVFDGFVVDTMNLTANPYLVYMKNSTNITIRNCELKNVITGQSLFGVGIVIGNGSSVNTVSNNKIHDIMLNDGSERGYGLYLVGTDNIIESNEIWHMDGFSIHGYNAYAGGGSDRNIIRNNRIHDNQWTVLVAAGGDSNVVHNNVIYNNIGPGIQVGGYGNPSTNNKVYNNTIYHNTERCIELGSQYRSPNNTTFQNNICWQNRTDPVVIPSGTNAVIDNNLIDIDPRFVNPAEGDFHLQPNSPALTAGKGSTQAGAYGP